MFSIERNYPTLTHLAIALGANAQVVLRGGSTLLHYAASKGYAEIAHVLIEYGKVNVEAVDGQGKTPVNYAILKGHAEATRVLIVEGQVDVKAAGRTGNTFLHIVSLNGHAETARVLMVEGHANANATDQNGLTPLHCAAIRGHTKTTQVLIMEGNANVNAVTRYGNTPLHLAAKFGNTETVRSLIVDGHAEIDPVNNDNTHESSTELGIPKTPIESWEAHQVTPLHSAVMRGHIEVVRVLIAGKANVNARNKLGLSPLHLCALLNYANIAQVLIMEGHAEVNSIYNKGDTPLHWATQRGHIETARVLIKGKADTKALDGMFGQTPLHQAVKDGKTELVHLLIVNGKADVNAPNRQGKHPIEGVYKGNSDLIGFLELQGARLPQTTSIPNEANSIETVHEISVLHTVSQAAIAFHKRYKTKEIAPARVAFISWVNSLTDKVDKTKAAKHCIQWMQNVNFKDIGSQITLQQALGLVWLAIHDPKAQANQTLTEMDFANRRSTLITALYEMSLVYNLDAKGNVKNRKEAKSCDSGCFNLLITMLAGCHDEVKFLFVNKETIALKAKALFKEYFLTLEEDQKQTFAQAWTVEKGTPETLINLFKADIQKSLHAEFDELSRLVWDYDQAINQALNTLTFMNPPFAPKAAIPLEKNADQAVTPAYQLRARKAASGNLAPKEVALKPSTQRMQ